MTGLTRNPPPARRLLAAAAAMFIAGCQTQHKVETNSVVEVKPIKIEPIYARIDVHIKIDKELDSFFDFEESIKPKADEPKKSSDAAEGKAGAS